MIFLFYENYFIMQLDAKLRVVLNAYFHFTSMGRSTASALETAARRKGKLGAPSR